MSVQDMPKVRTVNKKPPGPRGSLILGCLPEIQNNILPFVERVARDYGDIARIRLLPGFHCIMLSNPDHYRQVLVKGSDKYIKELTHFDILSLLIGKGVITLNREPWRERRKLIQPAFHRQLLSGFADVMTKATGEMLARWRERGPDPSLDIEREMTDLTLTIATRSFLSVDFSGELEMVGRAFAEATQLMAKRWANPLSYRLSNLPTADNRAFNAAVKTLDDLVYRIIAERRRSNNGPGDILSMLLTAKDEETGRMLTDRELRDEIMAVMIAGHETSSAALTWTWYLLSQNPEAERKLLAELASVLGGRLPKLEDLPNLKFTRWAFEEAMRLYPPGYILGRRAMSDDEIGGYHIPAGTAVYLAPLCDASERRHLERSAHLRSREVLGGGQYRSAANGVPAVWRRPQGLYGRGVRTNGIAAGNRHGGATGSPGLCGEFARRAGSGLYHPTEGRHADACDDPGTWRPIAFSSEVDAGSSKENASKQKSRARF